MNEWLPLAMVGVLLMAAGAGLWAVMAMGAAGRRPAWWGMVIAVAVPLLLLALWAAGMVVAMAQTFPSGLRHAAILVYNQVDILIEGTFLLFGLSFLAHAFRLRAMLRRTQEMEDTCRRMMRGLDAGRSQSSPPSLS